LYFRDSGECSESERIHSVENPEAVCSIQGGSDENRYWKPVSLVQFFPE
jgi:hypothetical protein